MQLEKTLMDFRHQRKGRERQPRAGRYISMSLSACARREDKPAGRQSLQ